MVKGFQKWYENLMILLDGISLPKGILRLIIKELTYLQISESNTQLKSLLIQCQQYLSNKDRFKEFVNEYHGGSQLLSLKLDNTSQHKDQYASSVECEPQSNLLKQLDKKSSQLSTQNTETKIEEPRNENSSLIGQSVSQSQSKAQKGMKKQNQKQKSVQQIQSIEKKSSIKESPDKNEIPNKKQNDQNLLLKGIFEDQSTIPIKHEDPGITNISMYFNDSNKQKVIQGFLNSKLIRTQEHMDLMYSYLPQQIEGKKPTRLVLLFRSSDYEPKLIKGVFKDKYSKDESIQKFKQMCTGIKNTITVCRTKKYKQIIGGFTPLIWTKENAVCHTTPLNPTTFLFNLNQKVKLNMKLGKKQVQQYIGRGSCFGSHDLSFHQNFVSFYNSSWSGQSSIQNPEYDRSTYDDCKKAVFNYTHFITGRSLKNLNFQSIMYLQREEIDLWEVFQVIYG